MTESVLHQLAPDNDNLKAARTGLDRPRHRDQEVDEGETHDCCAVVQDDQLLAGVVYGARDHQG